LVTVKAAGSSQRKGFSTPISPSVGTVAFSRVIISAQYSQLAAEHLLVYSQLAVIV